jgi:hypothetical protein
MLLFVFFRLLQLWISFSPIADITAEFYGVDAMAVNWLSLVFLVASIPCGFFATWLLDTLGLRIGVSICDDINRSL